MENEYMFENERYTKTHNMIRWKSGKRVDPRLLALLESFGEIYVDRREFFKKIFDETYEELFEKIGSALRRGKKMKKARSMSRSLSMRAIGKRGLDQDVELEGIRLERFRIRTPKVIEVAEEDGPTQASSNDSK